MAFEILHSNLFDRAHFCLTTQISNSIFLLSCCVQVAHVPDGYQIVHSVRVNNLHETRVPTSWSIEIGNKGYLFITAHHFSDLKRVMSAFPVEQNVIKRYDNILKE